MYPRQRSAVRTILASAAIAMFAILSGTNPAHAQGKLVLADYIIENQDYSGSTDNATKVAAYEREILEAQAAGIDGFALDTTIWLQQTKDITEATQIFQAAVALNNGFKLCMAPEDFLMGSNDIKDMIRRFANDPTYSSVYLKINNKAALIVGDANTLGTTGWAQIRSDLANGTGPVTPPAGFSASLNTPLPITFIAQNAFGSNASEPTLSEIQTGFNQWASTIDGEYFPIYDSLPGSGGSLDSLPSSENFATVVHGGGKLYAAPATFQAVSGAGNEYFEYSGYSSLRKQWMDAINVSHPDLMFLQDWNNFDDGAYISPIDDPNKYPNASFLTGDGLPTWGNVNQPPLGYYHSHHGATALTSYYAQWYKTGTQPAISKDTVYWAYRTQSTAFDAPQGSHYANKIGPSRTACTSPAS